MPIDFHDPANGTTYAQRPAGTEWIETISSHLDAIGTRVVDVGCGGGTYCLAWLELGAASVVGVDFAEPMLAAAAKRCVDRSGLSWQLGEAVNTGLPDANADVVFERALVHHLGKLEPAFTEARRILTASGSLIVQDRTMDNVTQPGSTSHLRGFIFREFPELIEVERKRRPSINQVNESLLRSGFADPTVLQMAETRRTYLDHDEVRDDILARTGRSILHELNDAELRRLADRITAELPADELITEIDYWTVWIANAI